MQPVQWTQNACLLAGRFLLGIYFILPGISKITGYEATATYMAEHNVPMIAVLLPITIILQIGLGATMIVGFQGRMTAFLLAGMTILISIYMHNFWDMAEGTERAHETQNFFKNMGITAGLLTLVSLGSGSLSLDSWLAKRRAASTSD
jgi:putative oxidoreductase